MSSSQPANDTNRSENRLTGFEKVSETGTFRNLRFLTDSRKINQPKTTLIVLGIATLIALAVGWLLISRMEVKPRKPSNAGHVGQGGKMAPAFLSCSLDRLNATALASGTGGDFYAAYGKTVVRRQLIRQGDQIQTEPVWSQDFDAPVTALCYVSDPKSLLVGRLLVGFADKIETVDPERADGKTTLFATLDSDSRLTALAAGKEFVFAADIGQKTVHRFTALGEKQRDAGVGDEKGEGGEGENSAFPGFEFGTSSFFDLDYAPRTGTLYVTNPGKFRIEAFDGLSGQWRSERSFEKRPGTKDGFSGDANPAVLRVLPSDTLLTIEQGEAPVIRNFSMEGEQRAIINDLALPVSADGQSIVLSATGKMSGKNYLLLLTSEGRLGVWPEPVINSSAPGAAF